MGKPAATQERYWNGFDTKEQKILIKRPLESKLLESLPSLNALDREMSEQTGDGGGPFPFAHVDTLQDFQEQNR